MSEYDDLTARLGDIEAKTSGLDAAQRQLLDKLQQGLERAHETVVRKKSEIAGLTEENRRLRGTVDRLLAAVESRSEARFTDQLQDLDGQLAALLALSEDEAMSKARAEAPLDDEAADPAADDTADAADQSDPEPESRTLSDIESRVEQILREMESDSEPDETPDDTPDDAPDEELNAKSDQAAAKTRPAEPNAKTAPAADKRTSRSQRPTSRSAAPFRAVATGPRLPYSSEVDYALGILRQMKRGDQTFSVDDVRELINGKFNLGLAATHDKDILSNLAKRRSVAPTARNRSSWKFVQVA